MRMSFGLTLYLSSFLKAISAILHHRSQLLVILLLAKSSGVIGRVDVILSPSTDSISHGKHPICQHCGILASFVPLLHVRKYEYSIGGIYCEEDFLPTMEPVDSLVNLLGILICGSGCRKPSPEDCLAAESILSLKL